VIAAGAGAGTQVPDEVAVLRIEKTLVGKSSMKFERKTRDFYFIARQSVKALKICRRVLCKKETINLMTSLRFTKTIFCSLFFRRVSPHKRRSFTQSSIERKKSQTLKELMKEV
jgi:hypothetical protein